MQKNHPSKFYLNPISKASLSAKMATEINKDGSFVEPMSLDEIIELRQKERKKLLALYGQSTDRFNEVEHTLYLKHQFISKTLPYEQKDQYEILSMLLADRGTLFTYGNDGYWNRKINHEINSKHRRLSRDKTLQEKLYQGIQAWQHVSSESEKKIHIELLRRITRIAAEKHQNLSSWVKGNISREIPSIEERMSLVKLPPEYQGEEKTKMLKKIRPLISKIIPDPMCRRMLSQSPAYLVAEQNLELFQDMLPEHRDKIDSSFCRTFVNDILPDYMQAVERAKTLEYRPDHVPDCHKIDITYDFTSYKKRLLRLESERKKFQQEISSYLELSMLVAFGKKPVTGKISNDISSIGLSIISYFDKLNYPLNQNDRKQLNQRINWALGVALVKNELRPVFILYMVICCGRRLTLDIDVEIPQDCDEKGNVPHYIKRRGWSKQRYEQLLLLDKLCSIFCVTDNERSQNWTQFLYWQGKNIVSEDEYDFWISQKKEHKFIPDAINFQLLCRKYLKECFPIYIQYLSYNFCSKLHLGGFLQFWERNQDKMREQAFRLEQRSPELIKGYFEHWKNNDVKICFFEGIAWMDNLLSKHEKIDLRNFVELPECDLQELGRLIFETECRICICRRSQRKLAKLLQRVYGFSSGLFQAILQE